MFSCSNLWGPRARFVCTLRLQNGGSLHDAEIHMVHVKEGTTDDLLVVGIMLDASTYGLNSMVGRKNESIDLNRLFWPIYLIDRLCQRFVYARVSHASSCFRVHVYFQTNYTAK